MTKKNKPQLCECGNCIFSNPIINSSFRNAKIECRRLPPVQDPTCHNADSHPHPVVRSDGWCGEYKPSPEKEDGKEKDTEESTEEAANN